MYKNNAKWLLLGILIVIALAMITASLGKYSETVSTAITFNIAKPTYTIRFHPNNGGADNYTTQSFTYGTSTALDPNTFTNGSMEFLAWTRNADGTGDSYEDEQVITTGLTQTNGDIIDFYAKWGVTEYWVTYVYGAETFTGPDGKKCINTDIALFSQANIDRDAEVSCSVSNFTKVTGQDRDLIFSHQCETGSPYQGFSFGYRENAIKIQANSSAMGQVNEPWGKGSGSITYKKEGAGADRKFYVDGTYKLDFSDFVGTFEEPLVFGCNMYDNGKTRRYLHADLSNMTIKLKYSRAEIQQLYSNLPNPTRTAYIFAGWYTAPEGGTLVTSSTPITSTNITLYARWAYGNLVHFHANGGEGSMQDQGVDPHVNQAININRFSRSGYSFTGWNTSPDGSGTGYTDMQQTTFSGNTDLYAQWEQFHTGTDYFYANGSVCFNKDVNDIINTGIYLFSQANYSRNFEVYLEVREIGTNDSQAVLVNSKDETGSPYPGFVLRVNSSSQLQLKADRNGNGGNNTVIVNKANSAMRIIRIIRINGEIYYSLNGATFQPLLDFTGYESTATFSAPVAFGGAIRPDTTMLRPFNGTLANLFVGFVDSNITLEDYQGGYTAPRTGVTPSFAPAPANLDSLVAPQTLSTAIPSEIPTEITMEASSETSTEMLTDTPEETSTEMSTETSSETPDETSTEMSTETSSDTPEETSSET